MDSFVLTSPFKPDEVLTRLSALADEWRGSTQPAAVRALPALRLKVIITGSSFRMFVVGLQPTGLFTYRGRLTAVCIGRVEDKGTGSRIEAQYTASRPDWANIILLLAVSIGLAAWARLWIVAVVAALLFGGEFALKWAAAGEQRAALRAVLVEMAASLDAAPAALVSPAP